MDKYQFILFLSIGIAFLASVSAIKCHTCNLWRYKERYEPCKENPKNSSDYGAIVTGCKICVKVLSVHIGNRHPQKYGDGFQVENQEISRVCGGDADAKRFTDWCQHYTAAGGYLRRCYCSTDLCNSSSKVTVTFSVFFLAAFGYLIGQF